ncbi:MAG: thioredoxin family protein [Phycisphaeraceae bacterium]
MVLTPSTMLPLGTQAPDFALPDTDGKTVTLDDFKDAKALLVMFICNHCPYVIHVADELAKLGQDYQDKGVGIVAICSNNIETHPQDSPEKMKEEKAKRGYTFPYLFDETQQVAKAYTAACTPDFFLFDGDRKLVYRGQLDDSRPNTDIPVTGKDLRAAIDAVLAGQPVSPDQKPSMGCNIKWKPGNEPDYFKG